MRQLNRPHEAASCFAEALRLAPEDPNVHLEIAALSLRGGELEKARKALVRAEQLHPGAQPTREMTEQLARREARLAAEAVPTVKQR
jgi:Flp pilus assembly protein TadD